MPQARIREDTELSYHLDGPRRAPVLLLVTGLGSVKEVWLRQVVDLKPRWRVLTVDHRGMGRSTGPDAPFTLRDLAADLVALLDFLAIERAHVWGVSLGGMIAQELALGWPGRVDRLVLANTSMGPRTAVEGDGPPVLRTVPQRTREEIEAHLVPLLFGEPYRRAHPRAVAAFARARAILPPDPTFLARQWDAFDAFDSWDRVPQITHRTLVLSGALDAIVDPRNEERLFERLPDAVFHRVAEAGHALHVEQPEEVNTIVEHFLVSGNNPS